MRYRMMNSQSGSSRLQPLRDSTLKETMEEPTISIVVCSYNSAGMLEDALDCIERQEVVAPVDFEVLVVDDGSKAIQIFSRRSI